MRVTIGIASNDVAAIRLPDGERRARAIAGSGRLILLGITHQDPITYAYAINSEGEQFPGEPLLL